MPAHDYIGLAVVAVLAASLILGRVRQRELTQLVNRDPLTGAGNRRLLHERLGYELARHRRSGRQLAVIVLDIDDFKKINDTQGHTAGDRVLRAVAEALAESVRDMDTVIRHGGDEFCVVAPETDAQQAAFLVARIRSTLAEIVIKGRPLAATIDTAVFPHDGDEAELLLIAADAAERRAKSARYRELAAG